MFLFTLPLSRPIMFTFMPDTSTFHLQLPASPNQMKIHQPNLCAFCSVYLLVIFLFFVNLLLLQPIITSANAPTNETDRFALLKFRESITNDPSKILSSWNDSMHFCNWSGIICGRQHLRVTALDLQSHNLRGSISPYIGNLTFLRFINLQNNSLYGEIPQEVGHLFRLQHLNISNNTLGGEIPPNLLNCSKLEIISMSWNNLIGKVPAKLGSLMKLEFVEIGANNLNGGIPPSLGNLSSLVELSLFRNNLVGSIPDGIGRLKSLSLFRVAINKLSGEIPLSLYNISSLNFISVTINQLNGTLPANIGLTLPNLQHLLIGGNQFYGSIPVSLCNASQLQRLSLAQNNFVGAVPTNLGNLLHLWLLYLNENNLGRNSSNDLDFLTSLRNCSKLVTLTFRGNQFGGVLPNSVANLSTKLTFLSFGNNKIYGTIPAALDNLINLIRLGMSDNLFTGIIPSYFGKLQKMQSLELEGNSFSGKIPASIGNLTQLATLNLSQNKLEGSIPPSIGNFQSLQYLDISQNNLSGSIPMQIIDLSSGSLLKLVLSGNSLTGKLPVEVGKLKNLNTLDISENNLSGGIPRSIGDLLSLEYLYLQGNSFEGIIPSSLASLKGLQRVDVSRNNLSGLIPEGVEKLLFLEFLNISFNDIEGKVPTEGVFKNTSRISVTGNSKLCGGVPQLQLPTCPIKGTKSRKFPALKLTIIIVCIVLSFLLFSSFLLFHWRRKSTKKSPSTISSINLLPNVSYKSLYQGTEGFSSSNLIGCGSFGSVYKGVLNQDERPVAIKVLNLQQKGASKSFMAECSVLRNIRHRNLVKILTCCSSLNYNGDEFKALVFEFMTNGSLDKWLHPKIHNGQSRNLSIFQRLIIAIDVASALDYLHNHFEQPIIHCDLKPSNVLLDNDMVAHVSDFGLARLLSPTNNSSQKRTSTIGIKGSIGYVSPEYGMGGEASKEGDMYSYGILVLEMFIGRRPTDEMFKDGLNLHNFVKMSLSEILVHIVDPTLFPKEDEETRATVTPAARDEDSNENEIVVEEDNNNIVNLSQMDCDMIKCLHSVLDIGLACSVETPKKRMNVGLVVKELHLIKNAFLASGSANKTRKPNFEEKEITGRQSMCQNNSQ